ncbi:heavy-metal-associated domain-containing protein [Gemmatimonas sp. UBA7669]|jgi:copper chaperone CopZ|uniref:heavy-metal-associated domain-containing protein n=1 Tax=Gemmatimonas sp. UBA7669 TaxID=1946568 RepID=UPI0025BB9E89|nr:heavy-metal-associated domain-containing protein [Gemmatimonas sp. UBA7669]
MHKHDDARQYPAQLHFPLRGLAGEGAEAAIRASLDGMAGVLAIHVSAAQAVAEVTYDLAVVSPEALRARLQTAGVKQPKHTAYTLGAESGDAPASRPAAGGGEVNGGGRTP